MTRLVTPGTITEERLLDLLLPVVGELRGGVLVGRGRRRGLLPSDLDRAWHQATIEALKDADLVGFSTYVWNGRISLEIARRLKAAQEGRAG